MKRYKVSHHQGEADFVVGDDWFRMEEQYVFTRDGETVACFDASSVRTINTVDRNYQPLPPGTIEITVEGVDAKPGWLDPNAGMV